MNAWKTSSYQGGLSWDLFLLSILVGKCCHWHWLSTSLSPVVQVPESLLLNTPFTTSALTSPIKNFSVRFSSISFIDYWGRLSYLFLLFLGTLHSNGNIFPFILCFSLLFTAICKASSDSHFVFSHFFSMGMLLIPVSYTMSWTSIHSPSGTLSIRSSPSNLFLTSTV